MTIYQEELKRRLKEQGYGAVYDEESEMLKIYHNGVFICDQGKNGELVYDSKIINESHYIRKIFGLIKELERRMSSVIVENQDFEALIKHYDRPDSFFYADPPYFSTEDMYAVGFNWQDHVRLRDTLQNIKGRFLLSYNDCPEIRELYQGFSIFDFSRVHSMAQRYDAGKEFKELLIGNYDLYEREREKPLQLTFFEAQEENFDFEKILKECIISCKIRR